MIIKLNKLERGMAEVIARKRYENNRKKGNPNEKIGKQSDWKTDLEGAGAELAWCKAFNAYPDLETDNEVNPIYDAVTNDGRTVDVKSTVYETGRLAVRLSKSSKAKHPDVYALMVGKFPEYRVAGHYDAIELMQPSNVGDLGYGATYLKDQCYLRKDP